MSDLGIWSVVHNKDAGITRRGAKRVVPMEVLSLGVHRTGTASMNEALRILGYKDPYHFSSIFVNVQDADMWNEALAAKYKGVGKEYGRAEFDQLLGHCSAVTDSPPCVFWKELIEAYPEAKVILIVRDEEKWLASFKGLVMGVMNPLGRRVLRYTDPLWFGRVVSLSINYISYMYDAPNQDAETILMNARKTYRDHNAGVRAAVPADRLLSYELGSGWEPLCKFLDKDVPSVPFPHRNEAKVLRGAMGAAIKKSIRRSKITVGAAAAAAGLVFGVYYFWR